jgi:ribosome-binding factor A
MRDDGRRPRRVASLLQEALSRILVEELRGVASGLVTVTRVDVPADLKSARVAVSVFGGSDPAEVLAHLERRTGGIRKLLASSVKLKYNPMLFFALDPSAEIDNRIERLLQETRKDDRHTP